MTDTLIRGERREVAREDVRPNPWNPNKQSDFMYEREVRSIKEFGLVKDITVRSASEEGELGYYEVIDGEHRLRAMGDLGAETITVLDLGMIPDAKAKLLTQLLNRISGEDDKEALSRIIGELLDEEPDFADLLPYTELELGQLRTIAEFDWDSLDGLDDGSGDSGESDEKFVTFKFKVPEEAADVVKRAIKQAKSSGSTDSDGRALELVCADYLAS